MNFTIDLIVFFSSNTNKVAIAGPKPPIICRIVPKGWENGTILRLVNAATPHHAIQEIRNVMIRNFASLLEFNLVYLLLNFSVPIMASNRTMSLILDKFTCQVINLFDLFTI